MTELKRTHYCGGLRKRNDGDEAVLMGWVDGKRDLGSLVFVDLRDRSGLVQVVFGDEIGERAYKKAEKLRTEFVIAIKGKVVPRSEKNVNPDMATGEIEVEASELEVLAESEVPPFEVEDDVKAMEELRLRHRYLDLRRPVLQKNLKVRHDIILAVRNYFSEQGFIDIETPGLIRSTPEGARDYIVPSRIYKGKFYALPQSPQILKQLLMIAGFDRYFQIARCFRDEDLRSHRQPEFTQIDVEMSFAGPDDIINVTEGMMEKVLGVIGKDYDGPFRRISFREALDRFGLDAPDDRFGMELTDLTESVKDSEFKVFSGTAASGGYVKAISAPGCSSYSRKDIDELENEAKKYGAKGLIWMKVEGGAVNSPIAKFLSPDEQKRIAEDTGAREGHLILTVAGDYYVVSESLGRIRNTIARKEGMIDEKKDSLLWVVDFPLAEYDEKEGRYAARHHAFTAPLEEDLHLLEKNPRQVRAKAYDLIWNGVEMGGGSIRNHTPEMQKRVFEAIGVPEEEAEKRFGFFLNALKYGAPPHGGIALGVDRLVMNCLGTESLRDVIAFPKTTSASDLMMDSPSAVDYRQLDELGLQLKIREDGDEEKKEEEPKRRIRWLPKNREGGDKEEQ